MEKIRKSSLLKITCYILIPIIVALIGISIFHLYFLREFSEVGNEGNYIETEQFANSYFQEIKDEILQCERVKNGNLNITSFYKIDDDNGEWYYYTNKNKKYYNGMSTYIDFIIINKKSGTRYTNIKSQNYDKDIKNIKNQNLYWIFEDKKIDTNIEKLNHKNIKYNTQYSYLNFIEEDDYNKDFALDDYKIYTYCNESEIDQFASLGINKQICQFMMKYKTIPIYVIVISFILLITIGIFLIWSIGYKKGIEEINLNRIDNLPYEIIFIICIIGISSCFSTVETAYSWYDYIKFIMILISYFIGYVFCAILGVTTIKRIKARTFIKSFIIYKISKRLIDKIKKYKEVISNKAIGKRRVFWIYWGFVFISTILVTTYATGIGLLLLIAFWIWTYYKIREYQNKEQRIEKALQNIYEGKTDIHLDDSEMKGTLKHMTIYVNDIAGGFSNAIEQSLKSERLKTELITNVSHDIKTPLTSIINYVDLLKKEQIEDIQIKEYIDILDKKSQRLKKLIEDLVEASKVSSGNVKLNIEKINIKELINQTVGEFKDKFEQKELSIEMKVPKEDVIIDADSRYMYRVIENLFSNITKYAVEKSRVYIDIEQDRNEIRISFKNISKDKLNISSDELMQRFVRGDKSRYTEGSGLGLSIAQSLTSLQKGKLDIIIDGDLFKVQMIWEHN